MSAEELSIKLLLEDKEALSKFNSAMKQMQGDAKRSADSMNLAWAGFASQLFVVDKLLRPTFRAMKEGMNELLKDEDELHKAFRGVQKGIIDIIQSTPEFRESVDGLTKELNQMMVTLAQPEVFDKVRLGILQIQKTAVLAAAGVTGIVVAYEKLKSITDAAPKWAMAFGPLGVMAGAAIKGVDTSKTDEMQAIQDDLIKKAVEIDQKQDDIRNNKGARIVEQAEREKLVQIEKDQLILQSFLGAEQIKIDALLRNTEVANQIRQEETLKALSLKEKELLAKGKLSEMELTQLKAIEEAKGKVQSALAQARFEETKQIALAGADLLEAVSIASGKSMLKGAAIVLKAVIATIELMNVQMDPFLRLLKIATTVVSAGNALAQLSAAEKALEAQRGQSIQAVTNVPGLAAGGTVTRGGSVLVGERGPELLSLPAGASVAPLAGGSGNAYHINVQINGDVLDLGDFQQKFSPIIGQIASEFIDKERERL